MVPGCPVMSAFVEKGMKEEISGWILEPLTEIKSPRCGTNGEQKRQVCYFNYAKLERVTSYFGIAST